MDRDTMVRELRERKKWIRQRHGLTGETLAQERELEQAADMLERDQALASEAAAAKIAELEADAARLDFMEANPKCVTRAFGYLGSLDAWTYTLNGTTYIGQNLRETIDSAIAARSAKGGGV